METGYLVLDKKWQYVVRDRKGNLFVVTTKPIKTEFGWEMVKVGTEYQEIDKNYFPNVKWEDEQATEI